MDSALGSFKRQLSGYPDSICDGEFLELWGLMIKEKARRHSRGNEADITFNIEVEVLNDSVTIKEHRVLINNISNEHRPWRLDEWH